MDSTRDLKTLTLGTLSEPSSRVCLPSTLSYAERMHLKEHDPVEYARYNLVTSLLSYITWIELVCLWTLRAPCGPPHVASTVCPEAHFESLQDIQHFITSEASLATA